MAKLNIITLGSSKNYTDLAALGLTNVVVNDQDKTISFTLVADGSTRTLHFDQPSDGKDGQDGISVTGVNDLENGKFTLLLSDGSETDPIQTVKGQKGDKGDKLTFNDLTDEEKASLKGADGYTPVKGTDYFDGQDGFSPIIEENENNTDKIYKLDITTADSTFTTPNLKGADGQGGTGGSGTAEDTTYTNENFPQYDNVDLALDALFNKVYYVKPTCSLSATPSGGTFEIGTAISAPITFTWTTNKDITSQTLTGCTLANASVRTATYNTNVTSDKTFTLSVSDGENSASSSVSYKFLNNIFWGSASTAETYDSAFISALSNKKLASVIKGTYSFNIASGEYGFWAVPSNMTISSVWIGGFEVTVDDLGTVSYTNAQGYTRDYKLYKTGKASLGAISAEIK